MDSIYKNLMAKHIDDFASCTSDMWSISNNKTPSGAVYDSEQPFLISRDTMICYNSEQ
tara:strand:+ start:110583 stop:110756 length:174 start_codon:yes stop_codon:yes gene_type:complete